MDQVFDPTHHLDPFRKAHGPTNSLRRLMPVHARENTGRSGGWDDQGGSNLDLSYKLTSLPESWILVRTEVGDIFG